MAIEVSPISEPITFPACCVDCYNPIIASQLYAGDTYIPFSLDMIDGTVVYDSVNNNQGRVVNGAGVIELSEPLVAGSVVKIFVNESNCKSSSSEVTVLARPESCDCPSVDNCHIRVIGVAIKKVGINSVALSYLSVEAFGELRYRIDNGEWFSDWASIGSFSSLTNHTLGIKLVNDPSCRIEYPFLAISYT